MVRSKEQAIRSLNRVVLLSVVFGLIFVANCARSGAIDAMAVASAVSLCGFINLMGLAQFIRGTSHDFRARILWHTGITGYAILLTFIDPFFSPIATIFKGGSLICLFLFTWYLLGVNKENLATQKILE